MSLFHELSHAYGFLVEGNSFFRLILPGPSGYPTMEEYFAVMMTNSVARQLREPERQDYYSGIAMPMNQSVISSRRNILRWLSF